MSYPISLWDRLNDALDESRDVQPDDALRFVAHAVVSRSDDM